VRCCHCGIRFLTHPRNAGRLNLRCAFGCRQHHRRQCANERSRKHYRTPDGNRNKKHLNGKRSPPGPGPEDGSPRDMDASPSLGGGATPEDFSTAPCVNHAGIETLGVPAAAHTVGGAPRETVSPSETGALPMEGLLLDESTLLNSPILPYVRMVASLIERRTISRDELLAALQRSLRQRSFDRRPRREYVLHYLHEHPP